MKTLWTPWRMVHVTGQAERSPGCLFDPPGESTHDKDLLLLYRDDLTIVLLNRFPYSNGHLLVAPRRHVPSLTDLEPHECTALMLMIQRAAAILNARLAPHGLNIGCNIGPVAGAGVADHLHFHLVPRWQGDHNFMTVISEIRAIPEHIDLTFDRLLAAFHPLVQERPEPA